MSSTAPGLSLLVVDDEPDLRTLYELTLLREGYELETAGSVGEALEHLARRRYSAVITDMRLPDGSGLDILNWLDGQGRPEKALVITAFGSAEGAVEALKAGAYDYLTKPVDLRQFRLVVATALGRASAAPPAATAAPPKPSTAPKAAPPAALERLAGQSQAMQQVRALIEKVARSMAPVLLQGESGTGKELVARAIHDCSVRLRHRFVAVNCGAIPEQLLEAEFFGYRKGAFTGAAEDREGFFQAADGGTLFLDEIGDLPLAMQSKLLRAIQERAVRPVGAVTEATVNVRIVSATHKDLGAEVAAGRFRQDLFYRLNVIQIRVPPLRERIEDVPLIAERVLTRIAGDAGVSPVPRLTPAALSQLARYAFPGNVRELENLLHRALALSGGELIDDGDLGLPESLLDDSQLGALDALEPAPSGSAADAAPAELPRDLAVYLDEVERSILLRALEAHRFNRTAAGASLGLSLRQMRYRMARLNIGVGEG
ncbi:sigma-54 dependent transcriptional regulator [Paucibacter sp. R3-3]|uniref:Sigma-54 dependent transcriptional regulator n=1 Tax=Roseateles agri TaxID=3098619 RepID=A0ABU5DBT0_9BURK|nr:sigma-54 dependent transcriptional regulator [Paucibacter sp. R3-3]MDY0743266.1 sigma-54 dependent transcriptional regulator [Paucibacter sp. R3-3]